MVFSRNTDEMGYDDLAHGAAAAAVNFTHTWCMFESVLAKFRSVEGDEL
jgi:hypothetical protein